MKKGSTLLIKKEMKIKSRIRYHLNPVKMAIIKKMYNVCTDVLTEGICPTSYEVTANCKGCWDIIKKVL